MIPGSVGIIGYGAFGRLLARTLSAHAEVLVHDAVPIEDAGGARVGSLDEVAGAGAVVLAVNVQHLGGVLGAIAPSLRPGALVCDVCSVKLEPLALMGSLLPGSVRTLGTHPLFGPQTVREKGLAGNTVALCPGRIGGADLDELRGFLEGTLGLRAPVVDPDAHDRQMAHAQVVTHLVGRALCRLELGELELGTLAYRRLLQIRDNVLGDSADLFEAIQRHNPHAAAARRELLRALEVVVAEAEG
ncbi:MAG: prephenate dehydrogenase [Planctomycetota bacterium]